ncbi:MAG: hypothetical protein ABIF71_06740 [Planctomycetota bacterium]
MTDDRPESIEDTQYILGGMAVSCGLLSEEQYAACYYEHTANFSHVPFEEYLVTQNILTKEEVEYLRSATGSYLAGQADAGGGGEDEQARTLSNQDIMETSAGLDPVPGYEALDPADEEEVPAVMEFAIEAPDLVAADAADFITGMTSLEVAGSGEEPSIERPGEPAEPAPMDLELTMHAPVEAEPEPPVNLEATMNAPVAAEPEPINLDVTMNAPVEPAADEDIGAPVQQVADEDGGMPVEPAPDMAFDKTMNAPVAEDPFGATIQSPAAPVEYGDISGATIQAPADPEAVFGATMNAPVTEEGPIGGDTIQAPALDPNATGGMVRAEAERTL